MDWLRLHARAAPVARLRACAYCLHGYAHRCAPRARFCLYHTVVHLHHHAHYTPVITLHVLHRSHTRHLRVRVLSCRRDAAHATTRDARILPATGATAVPCRTRSRCAARVAHAVRSAWFCCSAAAVTVITRIPAVVRFARAMPLRSWLYSAFCSDCGLLVHALLLRLTERTPAAHRRARLLPPRARGLLVPAAHTPFCLPRSLPLLLRFCCLRRHTDATRTHCHLPHRATRHTTLVGSYLADRGFGSPPQHSSRIPPRIPLPFRMRGNRALRTGLRCAVVPGRVCAMPGVVLFFRATCGSLYAARYHL